jgi:5-methyltetrahydropteroyltriglutamate--homocysteine methyltransferase
MQVHQSQTIGFPRIGGERQLKKALEAYWSRKSQSAELLESFAQVQREGIAAQREAGVDWIGIGDATLYDQVLDWTNRFGLIPERFRRYEGLDRYFAMARGTEGIPPLGLTKWYDTNYHYLVPEIDQLDGLQANFSDYFVTLDLGRELLGERAIPIVLGPVTLLSLARLSLPIEQGLEALLPLYRKLLQELAARRVPEVQLHEPQLVVGGSQALKPLYQRAYSALAETRLPLNLVTYFDDLGAAYPWAVQLPVSTLTLDFTRGDNLALIRQHGWPKDKTLGAGVVDGRSIWRIRPAEVTPLVEQLEQLANLRISASCSLQFVPYRADRETQLAPQLQAVLSFAEEKLTELASLAAGAEQLLPAGQAWDDFESSALGEPGMRARLQELRSNSFARQTPYAERRAKQIQLPPFPLTTIGSFPQTADVRRLRNRLSRNEISEQEYRAGVDAWIAYTIGAQEGLGLDVLVHGEFERSDMVEFFAEKLTGFAFTKHGWVQSYGNRYVRPPIIWGDVRRSSPMTVREFQKAQSFTHKPVKGMLTGPVTILNWSFVRSDIPRSEVAFQLALALREEISDLEAAGAKVIQVDEPALREGLPLKPERWEEYLGWAVDSFRLATGGARDETQVHTHMCYAEFGDIMHAIDGLNADVILIENARSGDETLQELTKFGYAREVGPGVYDVHSANIPEVEQVKDKLRMFARHFRPEQIWVNPDCGLKTRNWEEVLPSLGNIVEAVRQIREETGAPAG